MVPEDLDGDLPSGLRQNGSGPGAVAYVPSVPVRAGTVLLVPEVLGQLLVLLVQRGLEVTTGGCVEDGSGTINGRRGITEAAHVGDERTTLIGFLQHQRDVVAWKLRDVPDEVLCGVGTPALRCVACLTLISVLLQLRSIQLLQVPDRGPVPFLRRGEDPLP